MERLKEKLKKKLGSRVGESIAETLVALLIGALALTMLAGAITSASNMIRHNRDALDNYYDKADAMAEASTGSTGQISVKGSAGSTLSNKSYNVTYVRNDAFTRTPVVAYKMKKTD